MTEAGRPLSTLPWICFNHNPDLTLENSAVYNYAYETKSELVQPFKVINRSFPFFIPNGHHKMSTKEMLEKRTIDGAHWRTALIYLVSSKSFEDTFHVKNSSKNFMYACNDTSVSSLMESFWPMNNRKTPQSGLKAADFLLEPWVLVQLPFHSAIFHQWLIAFHVEIIRVSLVLSELCYMPLCQNQQAKADVQKIIDLMKAARNFVSQGFRYLQACGDSKETIAFPDVGFALYILDLIFQHDLMDVIKSYKRMLWAGLEVKSNKKTHKFTLFEDLNNIYSLKFWRGSTATREIALFYNSHDCLGDYAHEEIEEKFEFDNLLESLQAHCKNKLMLTEELKEFLKNDNIFMRALLDLKKHEENSKLLRIREEEHGIIGMMMSLSAYECMYYAADRAKGRLCEVTETHPRLLLRDNYENLPDESVATKFQSKKLLGQHRQLDKFDDLINRMEKVLKPNSTGQQQSPFTSAAQLETRIKVLVFNFIKDQYSENRIKNGGKLVFSSNQTPVNWQFQQYILPCFVASLYELTETEGITETSLEMYICMMNEMFKPYENDASLPVRIGNSFPVRCLTLHASRNMLRAIYRWSINEFGFSIFAMNRVIYNYFDSCIPFECLVRAVNMSVSYSSTLFTMENNHFDRLALTFFSIVTQAMRAALNKFNLSITIDSHPMLAASDMIDLIKTLIGISYYPENFVNVKFSLEMPDERNLLLALVKFCLFRPSSDNDLTSTRRLVKLKNLEKKGDKIPETLFEVAKAEIQNPIMSPSHVLNLALYLCMKLVSRDAILHGVKPEELDLGYHFTNAIKSYVEGGKMWNLRYLASILGTRTKMRFGKAKTKAPVLFFVAMNEIPEQSNKLKLRDPDHSWFFPLSHCRNCGVLDKKLDLQCDLCAANESYPDKYYFCSESCKTRVTKKKHHKEEHIEYSKLRQTVL